jgi:putative flippase GtrA
MRVISDPATRTYKGRQTIVVGAMATAIAVGSLLFESPKPSAVVATLVLVTIAGCFAYTMNRRLWFVADVVSEDGSSLLIRRGTKEVTVPLSEVADVYPVTFYGREGLQISLRSKVTAFGLKVVFLPPEWRSIAGEQMDQVAVDLKRRLGIVAA